MYYLVYKGVILLKYLTRDELRNLTATQLLLYVNKYLANGGSMNQFEKYHHGTTKKYIKNKLNELNVGYNQDTNQYESVLESVSIKNEETNTVEYIEMLSNEQNQAISNDNSHEVVNLLSDIKKLLEVNNSRLGSIADEVVEIKINTEAQIALQPTVIEEAGTTRTSIDNIKPLRTDEDLVTRNVKVYPTIMKRLKRLVDDTDYQQQQVLSALLDEVLTKYGY